MGKTYQKPDTEWMKGNLPLERIAGATYQLQCDYIGKNHEQISTELILAAMNEAFRRGSQSIQDSNKVEALPSGSASQTAGTTKLLNITCTKCLDALKRETTQHVGDKDE